MKKHVLQESTFLLLKKKEKIFGTENGEYSFNHMGIEEVEGFLMAGGNFFI